MRVRYTGADAPRDLLLSGGCLRFDRDEWVDIHDACVAVGIAPRHADIEFLERVAAQPDWDVEFPKPASKSEAKRIAALTDSPPVKNVPATPDEE